MAKQEQQGGAAVAQEVKPEKLISVYPSLHYRLKRGAKQVVQVDGRYREIVTDKGVSLHFRKCVAEVHPDEMPDLRTRDRYGLEYISLSDWRKLYQSKNKEEKRSAQEFFRAVKNNLKQSPPEADANLRRDDRALNAYMAKVFEVETLE